MKIYSDKAFEIIGMWKQFYEAGELLASGMQLTRDADGAIILGEWLMSKMKTMWQLAKQGGVTNTLKTRATDTRVIYPFKEIFSARPVDERFLEFGIEARTMSLLYALMTLDDARTIDTIRKNWGDEAVDEMIGHPYNAMIAARRGVILTEIEQVKEEVKRSVSDEYDRYKADYKRVVGPLEAEIADLDKKMKELQEARDEIASKKNSLWHDLEKKRDAAVVKIRHDGDARIAWLRLALD